MSAQALPVLRTAAQGWRLLAGDWSVLLRVVALPLAALVALDFYLAGIWKRQLEGLQDTNLEHVSGGLNVLMIWDMALALVLGGLIVALWHRARLIGRPTLSIFRLLAAWRNIAALTTHWCALVLVTTGLTWVIGSPFGPSASGWLSDVLIKKFGLISHPALYRVLLDLILDGGPLLFALYVAGRLGLMLWARPAGGEGALDRAWSAGDGNGWRIAAAILLAILPVMILDSALQPGTLEGVGATYIFLWSDLSNLLQLIVAASVIAAAHQTLLGGGEASEAAVPTNTPGL